MQVSHFIAVMLAASLGSSTDHIFIHCKVNEIENDSVKTLQVSELTGVVIFPLNLLNKLHCIVNWQKKIEIIICYVAGLLLFLGDCLAGSTFALSCLSTRKLGPEMPKLSTSIAAI